MPSSIQQTNPPAPAPPDVTYKLFRSWHKGAGDADEVHWNHRMETYMAVEAVTTRFNRIHGSIDVRRTGQIRMGYSVVRLAQPNDDHTPVFAAEWAEGPISSGLYPAVFYLVGQKIRMIMFGKVTEIGSNALGSLATGGMLDDDGSGIPYLYASFGGGTGNPFIKRMNLAQTVTTSADVVATHLLSLNGDAYRTIIPTGSTIVSQVSKCPYGLERFVAANWSAGVTVGFAGSNVNALVAVRQAPVAVKPEGIFAYNIGLDRWINYTPSWVNFRNLDNGKGSFFLGDQLVVPMGDGGAVIFDGSNVLPFDPIGLDATPNTHTTKSVFDTSAALRHYVAGVTKPAAKISNFGNSMNVYWTVDDSSYTDSSAACRNLDLTDGATLPANSALKIYVGWKRPFTAIGLAMTLYNLVTTTMVVKVCTVAAANAAASTWTAQSILDMTSVAGVPLATSSESVVMLTDPVDQTLWVPTTVNGVTQYWVQISFPQALTVNTKIVNVKIQAWYPSIDKVLFPLDGLDKSGCFPHIWLGRDVHGTESVWHDMVSLSSPDRIGSLIYADVGGEGTNSSRQLLAIGRYNVWEILSSDNDMTGTETSPVLNAVGLIEGPSLVPQAGMLCRLKELKIVGHDFDPAWKFLFYYTWDAGKTWHKTNTELRPPVLQAFWDKSVKGNRFRWAVGWSGTAGEAQSQPCITEIEATFEVLTDPLNAVQERVIQNKPRI